MKVIIIMILLHLNIYLFAAENYEKACATCDFVIIEKGNNKNECDEYYKYFFEKKKIGKAYEELGAYFIPSHKYAEFWKRYLPDNSEQYFVDKAYTDNITVAMNYEIIPKTKHIKEGKKANIKMTLGNERFYFQLAEITGGTEITYCYKFIK